MIGIDLATRTNDQPTRGEVQRMIDDSGQSAVQVPDNALFPQGALLWTGSGWITANAGQAVPYSTSLPPGANHGDEYVVYMGQYACNWKFKWNQQDQYWYFIGGAPATTFVFAGYSTTVANVAQFPSPANTLIVPFSGDYTITVESFTNNVGVSSQLITGVGLNGAASTILGYAQSRVDATDAGYLFWTVDFASYTGAAMTKGDSLSQWVYTTNPTPTNSSFNLRTLKVVPVRVKS